MANYNRADLMGKTTDELYDICEGLGIRGYWKKGKSFMADRILDVQAQNTPAPQTHVAPRAVTLTAADFHVRTMMTNPETKEYTSLITVSCGANTQQYPLVGRSVAQVKALLSEALNITTTSSAVVGGNVVEDSYILQTGDVLEFVKQSGSKA